MRSGERVVVAMSGGVDSSVAALLMQRAGHEVIGITMQMFDQGMDLQTGRRHGCCTLEDTYDARRVAEHLGFPHYVISHEAEFAEHVIGPYVEDYATGRTPSPCVRCNTYVKFDTLLRRARALGATKLITGHYARIEDGADGSVSLLEGRDARKDQSYFLWGVSRESLAWMDFPLGDRSKTEIRALAAEAGLPVAAKAESMETCFIGPEGPGGFVEKASKRLGIPILDGGEIVDEGGQVLGRHGGVHGFTVGQRKGLGVSGGRPLYVHAIDAATGRVRVGDRAGLACEGLEASGCNWLGDVPRPGDRLRARIRHRHEGAQARVVRADRDRVQIDFEDTVDAVAPGQALALYEGPRVVGGGWIAAPVASDTVASIARSTSGGIA